MRSVMPEFLDISVNSYYVWKKTSHVKLISFLEKYLSKDDIQEYLDTDQIIKFKLVKEFTTKQEELNNQINSFLNDLHDMEVKDENKKRHKTNDEGIDLPYVPYSSEFISYLLNSKEIIQGSEAAYLSERTNTLLTRYLDSMVKLISSDTNECVDETSNVTKEQIEAIINAIVFNNEKIKSFANRDILLQLEILKGSDFESLLKQSTKKQRKDYLRSFMIKWVSLKYEKDSYDTYDKLKMISDADLAVVSFKDIAKTIKDRPLKTTVNKKMLDVISLDMEKIKSCESNARESSNRTQG